jgi:hypothetical protein
MNKCLEKRVNVVKNEQTLVGMEINVLNSEHG